MSFLRRAASGDTPAQPLPSLFSIPVGHSCVLQHVGEEFLSRPMRQRMAELGLRAGTHIAICQKTAGGGRVLRIGNTRYAVDKDTSKQLMVAAGEN
ncbi:FeoA family protein [Corynebacterium flavescens]|uniref:FeoA family protein n=1 Tax=Corynebacterium flavescens TaxID=28028 RepID=UPI003FD3A643